MGKRSSFERRERDFYPTPKEAIEPLLHHVQDNATFVEPCAGDGALVKHLEEHDLRCLWASDIQPRHIDIQQQEALKLKFNRNSPLFIEPDYIITNPPWSRDVLHPMIDHFRSLKRTWLLFDADWMHTRQAVPYLKHCSKIVSVGRVKWIPDSKHTGKDNCCWYRFEDHETTTEFIGR